MMDVRAENAKLANEMKSSALTDDPGKQPEVNEFLNDLRLWRALADPDTTTTTTTG